MSQVTRMSPPFGVTGSPVIPVSKKSTSRDVEGVPVSMKIASASTLFPVTAVNVTGSASNTPLTYVLVVSAGDAAIDTFSDGEIRVKVNENVRGHDVFVIQSTSHPANDHLVELLIMIDALKRASAQRITVSTRRRCNSPRP